jgi:Zn-dependent protease with chaperone function
MSNNKQTQVQEVFPILGAAAAAGVLIPLAINIAALFAAFEFYVRKTKEDKKLSKKLNSILKDGKNWKVMIVPDKLPNAFAMHKPYVFLSTGLIQMMNEREIEATMVHEAGHVSNKDIWRDIIVQHSLIAILFTAAAVLGNAALGALLFIWFSFSGPEMILQSVLMRTMGRAEENKADSNAAKYGYAEDLANALKKLEIIHKRHMQKHCTTFICKTRTKIEEMFSEHPPLKQRVENIMKAKETWAKKNKSFVQYRNFFQKKLGVKKEG